MAPEVVYSPNGYFLHFESFIIFCNYLKLTIMIDPSEIILVRLLSSQWMPLQLIALCKIL